MLTLAVEKPSVRSKIYASTSASMSTSAPSIAHRAAARASAPRETCETTRDATSETSKSFLHTRGNLPLLKLSDYRRLEKLSYQMENFNLTQISSVKRLSNIVLTTFHPIDPSSANTAIPSSTVRTCSRPICSSAHPKRAV